MANNTGFGTQAFRVIQGYNNIDGVLGASTLPASITSGHAVTGTLNVRVDNGGNLTLPAGQKVWVQVVARPTSGSDVILKTTQLAVGGLAAGKSTSIALSGFTTSMTAGQYQILAIITPVQALTETSTDDNIARTNSSGGSLTLTVI